jgi:hypothetical protein
MISIWDESFFNGIVKVRVTMERVSSKSISDPLTNTKKSSSPDLLSGPVLASINSLGSSIIRYPFPEFSKLTMMDLALGSTVISRS